MLILELQQKSVRVIQGSTRETSLIFTSLHLFYPSVTLDSRLLSFQLFYARKSGLETASLDVIDRK